jgi:hypothetical protein
MITIKDLRLHRKSLTYKRVEIKDSFMFTDNQVDSKSIFIKTGEFEAFDLTRRVVCIATSFDKLRSVSLVDLNVEIHNPVTL